MARCSNQEDAVILQQAQKDGTLLTDTDEAVVLRQVANLVATVLPLDRQDDLLQAIAKKCYQEEGVQGYFASPLTQLVSNYTRSESSLAWPQRSFADLERSLAD